MSLQIQALWLISSVCRAGRRLQKASMSCAPSVDYVDEMRATRGLVHLRTHLVTQVSPDDGPESLRADEDLPQNLLLVTHVLL
jgi:hypothetical protein